jgi:hypothetical protein
VRHAKSPYLSEIEKTYATVDRGFGKALAACATAKQKQLLIASRDAARDAFWKAVASELADNSVFVKSIHRDLKAANAALKKSLASLEDVSAVLNAIAEAVRLAASLTALAAI